MTQAAIGGVMAEPSPIPPIAMPIPIPRESTGIQLATARLNDGRATPSPKPSAHRTTMREPTIPTTPASCDVAAIAVNAVQSDHQISALVRTILVFYWLVSHSLGI